MTMMMIIVSSHLRKTLRRRNGKIAVRYSLAAFASNLEQLC